LAPASPLTKLPARLSQLLSRTGGPASAHVEPTATVTRAWLVRLLWTISPTVPELSVTVTA